MISDKLKMEVKWNESENMTCWNRSKHMTRKWENQLNCVLKQKQTDEIKKLRRGNGRENMTRWGSYMTKHRWGSWENQLAAAAGFMAQLSASSPPPFKRVEQTEFFFNYLNFSFLTFSKSKYNWHLHCSSCLHKCVVWQFWCFLSKLNCCPTMFSKTRTRMCDKRVKGNRNAVWKSATFIWRRGEQLLVKSKSSFQLLLLLKLFLKMFAT